MVKTRRTPARTPLPKQRSVPFEFVLERLESIEVMRRPMFGALALYRGPEIILILREKDSHREDNGVWVATSHEHHESLRKDLPSLRTIYLFGDKITNWQNIPSEGLGFEEEALRACELILQGDPRIGREPKKRPKISKSKPRRRPR